MSGSVHNKSGWLVLALVVLAVTAGSAWAAPVQETDWRVGLAKAKITPEKPIWMAGYASRKKPSEGVLTDLYAKAMAIEDSAGERAVLLTADVIGYNAPVEDLICASVMKKTGLERRQILLNPSHTHTGPVLGVPGATGYSLEAENLERVCQYTEKLAADLADIAAAALADMKPARLSWGIGLARHVMNRREFTARGIRLGFNPRGYVDRSVPVLRVDAPDGTLRAVVFGCACHNTTLTGNHYELSGDYAGFAQQYVEGQHPGVQAMFMIGCGGSANPYPRGTVEDAQANGQGLGAEVCRVAAETGKLAPIRGRLRVVLDEADLPLRAVPREELEAMQKSPSYLAYNARRMIEALAVRPGSHAGRPSRRSNGRLCAAGGNGDRAPEPVGRRLLERRLRISTHGQGAFRGRL
jgi:neutral ceramidase